VTSWKPSAGTKQPRCLRINGAPARAAEPASASALSLVPRTTYLLRAGPIDKDAGCLDNAVRDAALCIAKAGADIVDPLFSPTAAEQIGLPLHLGGCGLHVPTSMLAAAAQLLSAALTQAAL
jgi:hypothetical protein